MKTLILKTTEEDIQRAAEIIKAGGLVSFPTETVYGLGANALNSDAVRKIYEAKGRPQDNPTIVHIADASELDKLTPNVTEDMKKLSEAFWPGPLTMVVPRVSGIPDVTTGGLDTVGIRLPMEETARALIRKAGVPVAAPSANISGKPSPTKAEHVVSDMDGKIDAIIFGSDSMHGIESTVVDMTGDVPCVLRPGVITPEMLALVLGKEVSVDPALLSRKEFGQKEESEDSGSELRPKAPGMKYKHYAPNAEMTIFEGNPTLARREMHAEEDRLKSEGKKVKIFDFSDEKTAARDFFSGLREADQENVDAVLVMALPEEGIGFAVMNRMLKAAGYNVKHFGGNMIIALAADHGGYELKNVIKEHLIEMGYAPSPKLDSEGKPVEEMEKIQIVDLGTNSDDSVDYPDYGKACAEAVASGKAALGIVCCGSGIGISIAANKVKGIRCALCTSVEMAALSKRHNNANMLALGGRTTETSVAIEIVDAWLNNKFEGDRHARRIAKLDEM